MAHGSGTYDGSACRFKLTHAGGVEGMDGGNRRAIERGVQLAPFARGHHGASGKTHGLEHAANDHWIGGEHFAQQGDGRFFGAAGAWRLHWASYDFFTGVLQHGAREHILGLGVRGHAKARHINADDSHAVDVFGQQLQGHAARSGHTQIDDDNGVVLCRVRLVVNRFADVLEQLARDQRLGIKRHVAHAAPRAVEMRGECKAVHAAGRARQNGGSAAHAQAYTQCTKGRAHALWLVVRTRVRLGGIVFGVLRQYLGLT